MLKLDVIPLREGGWDGWAYINDPRQQDERQERKSAAVEDDDLPF
jgi:hypothetical protein